MSVAREATERARERPSAKFLIDTFTQGLLRENGLSGFLQKNRTAPRHAAMRAGSLGPSHQASSAAAQARAGCGGQSACRDLPTDHGLYMTLKETQNSVTGNGLTGREDGDLDQINGKWGHEVRRQIHNGCSRLRAQDT